MTAGRFHFVDDYRKLVADLISKYPLEEAMSRAVGGSFDALGELEKRLLIHYGLQPEHFVVDVGCGSGRLACALTSYLTAGRVFGTDVVQELLDYARGRCPPTWHFARVDGIRIPCRANVADFACFFSVFTHLLHEESYYYLLEARRVVKPGGHIVFSFLEYEHNWPVFEAGYTARIRKEPTVHLNMFIGRDAIDAWAAHLGMSIVDIRAASEAFIELSQPIVYDDGRRVERVAALGQSVCVLRNDKATARA